MKKKRISNNVIRRLPRYLRKLDELTEEGVTRISSLELENSLGLLLPRSGRISTASANSDSRATDIISHPFWSKLHRSWESTADIMQCLWEPGMSAGH